MNGAGKTTITTQRDIRRLIGEMPILNPDARAQTIRGARPELSPERANLLAVQQIEAEVANAIEDGRSVLVETVLSSNKYLHHVRRAKQLGHYVAMIYVTLPSVEVSIERVALRVAAGRHDVPEAKLRARWGRSLDRLALFAPLVDRLFVFDNGRADGKPRLVADKVGRKVRIRDSKVTADLRERLWPLAERD